MICVSKLQCQASKGKEKKDLTVGAFEGEDVGLDEGDA